MPNNHLIEEKDLPKDLEFVQRAPIVAGSGVPPQVNDRYVSGVISQIGLETDTADSQLAGALPTYRVMPASVSGSAAAGAAATSSLLKNPSFVKTQLQTAANAAAIAALQQTTFSGAWDAATTYFAGSSVDFDGIIYTALQTSLNQEPDISPTYWQSVGASTFLGDWSAIVNYVPGDQVIDAGGGGGYYICTVANINMQPSAHPADWQLITAGNVNSFSGAWNSGTAYTTGQTVTYQGSLWVAIAAGTNNTPSLTSSFWTLLGSNGAFQGTWNSAVAYTANMTVAYQGNLYQAVQANTNQTPSPTSTTYWILTGPSTLDDLIDGSIFIKGTGLVTGAAVVIPNSNFEASASLPVPGWSPNTSTLGYATGGSAQSGNQSLTVTNGGYAFTNQSWACQPGDEFVIGGYAKSDGTSSPFIQLAWYDKTGAVISASGPFTASTSYAFIESVVTAPANTVAFRVVCLNGASGTASFDNIVCWKVLTLGTQISEGTTQFFQSAGSLTYRPTTNPLTSSDAGASATVSIASFTLATTRGSVSYNSGSVNGLSYGTLFYIYFQDSGLSGGSPTYLATTTKTTAIGTGDVFIGSITTVASGAPNNVGNNDGGVGQSYGSTALFLFGAATPNTSGAQASTTSPTNAIDGDQTTFASAQISNAGSAAASANIVLTAASPTSAPWSSLILNVLWSVPTNTVAAGTPASISYSYLSGGSTVSGTLDSVGPTTTKGLTTAQLTLANNVNLATLSVTLSVFRNNGTAQVVTARIYEAWVVGLQ